MRTFKTKLSRILLAAVLAATSQTSPVCAAEPGVAPPAPSGRTDLPRKLMDVTGTMLVGYGTNEFSHRSGAPNPFSVGFGLAFGLTFLDAVYLGTNVVYYVGKSGPNATNAETGQTGAFSMSTLTATLDAGYRIRFGGDIMLRPYVGVGLLERFGSIPGASSNVHRLYVAPSVALHVPLRGNAFFGAELRYGLAVASNDSQSNVSAFAAVGYRF